MPSWQRCHVLSRTQAWSTKSVVLEFGGSSYLGAGEWCVSDFLVSIIVYVLFENNKLAYELKFKVIAIFLSNHIHQIDLSEMDHDFSAKCAKKPQKKPKKHIYLACRDSNFQKKNSKTDLPSDFVKFNAMRIKKRLPLLSPLFSHLLL